MFHHVKELQFNAQSEQKGLFKKNKNNNSK